MYSKKAKFLISFFLGLAFYTQAQDNTIKGIVLNKEDRTALIGVSVFVKNSYKGVITDIDGHFTLPLKDEKFPLTLVFSYTGMKKREVVVNNTVNLTVHLIPDTKMLDEAVVMGYGAVKTKEKIIGSAEKVSSKELLIETTTPSFDEMLEGLVAGVQVEKSTGDFGGEVKVRIRGQGSMTQIKSSDIVASSQPLYILDGVPLHDAYAPNQANEFNDQKVNPLSFINPEDIESITVLKDATASAIYGANASNGVILITTKKGSENSKPTVSFSQNYSMSSVINMVEFLNTEQYVELFLETYTNSGYSETEAMSALLNLGYDPTKDIDTNWRDILLRTAYSAQTNISISGGTQKTKYRVSTSYSDLNTIVEGNSAKRFTTRVSLNTQVNKKLSMDLVLGFSNLKKTVVPFESYPFFPFLSPYDDDGNLNNSSPFDNQLNPLAALYENEDYVKTNYTNGSLTLNYKIVKGLTLSNTTGIDVSNNQNYVFASANNQRGMSRNGFISDKRSTRFSWLNFTQLNANYFLDKSKRHNVTATLGFQIEDAETSGLSVLEKNLLTESVKVPGLSQNENTQVSGTYLSVGGRSIYGRFDYSYDGKYNITANLRQDESSMFGGDFKKDLFSSIGASWLVNKEKWMDNSPLDLLKLRASVGKTGNSRIGTYASQGIYNYNNTGYNGFSSLVPSTPANPDLGWEHRYKTNIGLDAVYKHFGVTIEYYHDFIKNAISNLNAIPESGFLTIPVNGSDMENKGFEMTLRLNSIPIIQNNLFWTSNFNIATNKNVVTRMANLEQYSIDGSFNSEYTMKIGEDVSSILGTIYKGVYPEDGQLMYQLADGTITKDKSETSRLENKFIIGKQNPDFYGGWVNRFYFKGFDLGIKLTFDVGGNIILPWQYINDNSNGYQINIRNQSVDQLDRWQNEGDITDVPLLANNAGVPVKYSTQYLFDRTNIKLQSISFGYSLPKVLTSKWNISNVRVGAEVINVAYWYKDKDVNKVNTVQEYRYSFPEARTFTFNLRCTF